MHIRIQLSSAPSQAIVPHESIRLRANLWQAILILTLFASALVPRLLHLADFYTYDEAYHWTQRVQQFAHTLQTHSWAETNQTGHPGVTTMWLWTLGHIIALHMGIQPPTQAMAAPSTWRRCACR